MSSEASAPSASISSAAPAPTTTTAKPSYEERLKRYEWYIKKVAKRWAGDHPYSGEEDLEQELRLTLWKVYEADKKQPFDDFHYCFVKAVANTIASHYRLKQLQHDKDVVRMDATSPQYSRGRGERGSDPYPITRNEESEDFYRAGIFELIEQLEKKSPETAKVVMEALDANNRGPMHGRNKAYLEVKNVLQGNL